MPRSESVEQTMLVNRVRQFYSWALIFAIPNGGKRDPKEAARLKAEGVLAGVPDLMIPMPSVDLHGQRIPGLFIEMKRNDTYSTTSDEQDKIIRRLRSDGYQVDVCRGVEEAWVVVQLYLDRSPRNPMLNRG